MGNTPLKPGTYYARTREERRAYQNEYYQRIKGDRSRKNQLEAILNPESYAQRLEAHAAYQRGYYARNRERLLARRKEQYRNSKQSK